MGGGGGGGGGGGEGHNNCFVSVSNAIYVCCICNVCGRT